MQASFLGHLRSVVVLPVTLFCPEALLQEGNLAEVAQGRWGHVSRGNTSHLPSLPPQPSKAGMTQLKPLGVEEPEGDGTPRRQVPKARSLILIIKADPSDQIWKTLRWMGLEDG